MVTTGARCRDEMMGESVDTDGSWGVTIVKCRTEGCSAEGRGMDQTDYGARTDILISKKSIVWAGSSVGRY